MPQGLQVFNAQGAMVADITDRFTRLHSEGTVTPQWNGNVWLPITVNVPGMTQSDEWFVACTQGACAATYNGYFVIQMGAVSNPIRYSVFRR